MTENTHFQAPSQQRLQKPLEPAPAQVGDVWYRVDGSHLGDEVY